MNEPLKGSPAVSGLPTWQRYGLALVCLLVIFVVRWSLDPVLGGRNPFSFFFLAIFGAAWFGGFRPALLVFVCGFFLGDWFFAAPRQSLMLEHSADRIGAALYLVFGTGVAWVGLALQGRKHRLRSEQAAQSELLAELQAKESQLRAVTDTSAIMLTQCSRDLKYVFVNQAYAQMLGLPREQIIGRSIIDVMGEAGYKTIRPHVEKVLQGEAVEYETEVPFKSAGPRFLGVAYRPDRNEEGKVRGWVASISDISDRKRSEQEIGRLNAELQGQLEQMKTLLEILPVGVWVGNHDCSEISGNTAAYRIMGFNQGINASVTTARPEVPAGLRLFIDGAEVTPNDAPMQQVARSGKAWHNFEHELLFPDGMRKTVYASIAPLFGSDGLVRKVIAAYADFTERKRTEQQLVRQNQRLQLLSEAAGELLSAEDPQHMVRKLFGKVSAQLQLDAYFNFMIDEKRSGLRLDSWEGITEEHARDIETLAVGEAACGAVAQERKSMVATDVQHSDDPRLRLIRDLGIRAYVCNPLVAGDRLLGTLSFATRGRDRFDDEELRFLRTVSHYVAIARERTLHLRQLENLVTERTAKLRETVGELEAFSYSIAHDMRAPLRAMQGFAKILRQESEAKLNADEKLYLRKIGTSAARLDHLIKDVLNYSQIVREELRLEAVDVEQLILGILESYPNLQAPKAVIQIRGPLPRVLANQAALTQVVSNLLGNAVKFIAHGNAPQVRIWGEREDGHVRLWFEDNGIGIEPENQKRIFMIFQRLHRPELYEGTGIGLAIVRKAVERMGGAVGVESEPGQGSRFWVLLRGPESK